MGLNGSKKFKARINTRKADHFPCKICKKYVGRVELITVDPQVLHFRFYYLST